MELFIETILDQHLPINWRSVSISEVMNTYGKFDRIILHAVWQSNKTLSLVVNLNLSDIILSHAKALCLSKKQSSNKVHVYM